MDFSNEKQVTIPVLVDGRIIGDANALNYVGDSDVSLGAVNSGISVDISVKLSPTLVSRIAALEALTASHTATLANHEARLIAGGL